MGMDQEYRALLLSIARQIRTDELQGMSFLCAGMIPDRRREQLTETLQLFRELENQNKLGIDSLDYLIFMLENFRRQDLILKLRDFQIRRDAFLRYLGREDVTDSHVFPENATNPTEGRIFRGTPTESTNEVTVRCFLKLASEVVWCAGYAYILYRYKNEPDALTDLMTRVVLPSGILLRYLNSGSVKLVLWATDLNGLKQLWNRYKTGQLRDDLEKVLVTEDLRSLAIDEKIDFSVEMSEDEYRNACLDLMVAHCKATRNLNTSFSRPPRRTCSSPDMTSLHIQSFPRRDQVHGLSRDQLPDNSMLKRGSSSSVVISITHAGPYLSDLLNSSDRVPDVCVLLDKDLVLGNDWRSLASEFGYKMIDIYRMERKTSPTLAMLEDIAFKKPDTKTSKLIEKLMILKRYDVVYCIEGGTHASVHTDDPMSLRNLPFTARKEIAVEMDIASQAKFAHIAGALITQISPSQIESLRRRPSPTMALLEELETIDPSQPVSILQSACIKAKVSTAVTILHNYILGLKKGDRLHSPVPRGDYRNLILSKRESSQDSGIDGDEPQSP